MQRIISYIRKERNMIFKVVKRLRNDRLKERKRCSEGGLMSGWKERFERTKNQKSAVVNYRDSTHLKIYQEPGMLIR